MTLVERDADTSRLERFYDRIPACDPYGVLVVVSGAPGSGRSELLHHLADHAASRGGTTLHAVAAPEERHLPYALVDQLLCALPARGRHLRPQPAHAGPVALSPLQRLLAVRRALLAHRSSPNAPLLVTVDDVEFADPQSLRCLAHLLRHGRPGQLVVAVTHRQGVRVRLPGLGELHDLPGTLALRTRPLGVRGVGQFLTPHLGAGRGPRFAHAVHGLTGGSPLLLAALMSDRWAAKEPTAEDGEPQPGEQFRQAVLACVHRTGRQGLKVARGVALLGRTATAPLLTALTGVGDGALRASLAALQEAGVLDGMTFRHESARTAVLDDLPQEERARLSRHAAELLHHAGSPPTEVAAHLLAAASGPRRGTWAYGALTDAAGAALARGETALAWRCLRTAERHCRDERQRLALQAAQAQLTWRRAPSAAAGQVRALVAPARAGLLAPDASVRLASQLLWQGRMDDATEVFRKAGATARATPDPRLRTELSAFHQHVALSYPGVLEKAGLPDPYDFGDRPSPGAGQAAFRWRSQAALASVLLTHDAAPAPGDPEETLSGVPSAQQSLEVQEASLLALVHAGRLETAATWCERLLSEAERLKAPVTSAVLMGLRALIAARRGRLLDAAEHATAALRRMPDQSWGVGIGLPLSVLIYTGTAMGRHEEVTELLDRPVPREMFHTRYGLHYLYARGRHQLATGRAHAALADFVECGERMRRWHMDVPDLLPWRTGAAEAWLALNDTARAARYVDEQLSRSAGASTRARGAALRVLAATRPPAARRGLLERALEASRDAGDAYETARVLADLGGAHKEQKDSAKGRLLVRQALRAADECGAQELYRSLQPSPGRGAPPAPSGQDRRRATAESASLTAAERRVASLAAHGYTNRDIAAKLFITVSTVEQHLTRVYRKINIRHRKDLPTNLDFHVADTA
ncbi:helix-turn-helix transcriptional regulator [Streptomyces cinnamoneus]|uniref:helix-turn-helix transcriptional regulator n=1 Tax=Streptomyces cinnamoneus TaxID=53446 RepID=UPI0015E39255|nr:LuxR family transcriptional regulator [Streptomyces cinnamoneus]